MWQLDAQEQAAVALTKAQTAAVYAGLNLWPPATTAALVRSQLLEDGTYPGAEAVFGAAGEARVEDAALAGLCPNWAQSSVADYSPDQPRDDWGRWTSGGSRAARARGVEVGRGGYGHNVPNAGPASTSARAPGVAAGPSCARKRAEHSPGLLERLGIITPAEAEEGDPLEPETPEEMEEHQLKKDLEKIEAPLRGPYFGEEGEPPKLTIPLGIGAGAPSAKPPGVGVLPKGGSVQQSSRSGLALEGTLGQSPSDVVRGFAGPK